MLKNIVKLLDTQETFLCLQFLDQRSRQAPRRSENLAPIAAHIIALSPAKPLAHRKGSPVAYRKTSPLAAPKAVPSLTENLAKFSVPISLNPSPL